MLILFSQQHAAEIMKRKQLIEQKLEETGKKKELEEYLKQRLVECGWKDELKKKCLGIVCFCKIEFKFKN